MIALSERTRQHLRVLFAPDAQSEAERLLVSLDDFPTQSAHTPESLERLRFAALRVSAGVLTGLRDALALARADWRDLLMAADFGDADAHERWQP